MPSAAPIVEQIQLPKLNKENIQITLVGDTPLISHRFSEKAKKEMLAKQQKKAKMAKEIRDPEAEYLGSLYPYPGGGWGFPTIAFKAAAVTAANDSGIPKTLARRSFHVLGELVKIDGEPIMREDVVRLSGITRAADLRYRAEFAIWRVTLDVVYNASIISKEQLVNLFQVAGFGVGVGEWRPEKDGVNGLYHVATEEDFK